MHASAGEACGVERKTMTSSTSRRVRYDVTASSLSDLQTDQLVDENIYESMTGPIVRCRSILDRHFGWHSPNINHNHICSGGSYPLTFRYAFANVLPSCIGFVADGDLERYLAGWYRYIVYCYIMLQRD